MITTTISSSISVKPFFARCFIVEILEAGGLLPSSEAWRGESAPRLRHIRKRCWARDSGRAGDLARRNRGGRRGRSGRGAVIDRAALGRTQRAVRGGRRPARR